MNDKTIVKIILLLTFTYVSFPLWCQPLDQSYTDSVERELQQLTDPADKADAFIKLVNSLSGVDPQIASEYIDSAFYYANRSGNDAVLSSVNISAGNNLIPLGRYDEALLHFETAKKYAIAAGLADIEASATGRKGLVYFLQGNYTTALEHLMNSLEIFESLNHSEGIANTLSLVSNIYREQHFFERAIEYEQRALFIFEKLNDIEGKGIAMGNIASAYASMGLPDSALVFYHAAIEYFQQTSSYYLLATSFMNVSVIYTERNEFNKAYQLLQEAIHAFEAISFQYGIALAKGNMGAMLNQAANFSDAGQMVEIENLRGEQLINLAIQYLNESVDVFLAQGEYRPLEYFSKELSAAHEAMGSFDKAIAFFNVHVAAKDTLKLEESRIQMESIITQREIALRDKQIELDRLEILKQRNERIYFLSSMFLILIALLVIYRNYSNQRKANVKLQLLNNQLENSGVQLQERNEHLAHALSILKKAQDQLIYTVKQKERLETRERISQDIHDDISSELTKISWLAALYKSRVARSGRDTALTVLDKITRYSMETSEKLGEIIWSTNPQSDNLGSLLAYMRKFLDEYLDDSGFQYEVYFPEADSELPIAPLVRRNLYLALKETVHNAVKYSEGKIIKVSFSITNSDSYLLTIQDDGVGLDESKIQGTGFGLINLRKRVEAIQGKFNIESKPGKGTKLEFSGNLNPDFSGITIKGRHEKITT